jgi:colanic acid biosynthesis glycosyl transferase WcaI
MRILLLNQCFYPDLVSTAQHLSDLALGLKAKGHDVTVVASSRGYDNPSQRFPIRQDWQGIQIRRIWTLGLGKGAKWKRFADFGSFWLSAIVRMMTLPRFDAVVCLTSPPLISALGTLFTALKGGRTISWVMDLNPDEAVAAGWITEDRPLERVLSILQRWSFARASLIVALDPYMRDRLLAKGIPADRIHVDAPWSHDDAVRFDISARQAFRSTHNLTDKFVVMYSGNHSPCHPLDSLLEAAKKLSSDDSIHFLFVGGGSEHARVKSFAREHALPNIVTLPYQPLDSLSGSLSAADLHTVVMGEPFVGIVHPCKIYNVLRLGLPFLAIGPQKSHLGDIVSLLGDTGCAFHTEHGRSDSICETIRSLQANPPPRPCAPLQNLSVRYSEEQLLPRLIAAIEDTAKSATP